MSMNRGTSNSFRFDQRYADVPREPRDQTVGAAITAQHRPRMPILACGLPILARPVLARPVSAQPDLAQPAPATSARERTPNLASTAETWWWTVRSEMNIRREMAALDKPSRS